MNILLVRGYLILCKEGVFDIISKQILRKPVIEFWRFLHKVFERNGLGLFGNDGFGLSLYFLFQC